MKKFLQINGSQMEVIFPKKVVWQSLKKDCDAGSDWGQKGKGTTEDEMAGWHHRLDGHEFE